MKNMSADVKFEVFAYLIFHNTWSMMTKIKNVQLIADIYFDEYVRDDSFIVACDSCYLKAAFCRDKFFVNLYNPTVFIKEEKITCLSELYERIVRICDQDDLFGHLTVFEKMLSTSTFVATFCILLYYKMDFIDILKYGHILWAMYFEKYNNEFYEKGGWSELKRISDSYTNVLEFSAMFYRCTHFATAVKQAVVNYYNFKNTIDYEECTREYSGHVYKLWIKFLSENFDRYEYFPITYETSLKAYELDLLIKDLMLLLDPLHCNSVNAEMSKEKQQSNISTETSYSEIPCDNSTDCKGESEINCPISATEELTSDITVSNRNLEGNEHKGIVLLNELNDINSTNNSQIEQNISSAIDINLQSKITNKISPNGCNLDLDCSIESKSFLNKNEESSFELFNEQNGTGHKTANTDKFASLPYTEKTESHSNPIPEDCVESDVLNFPRESISNKNQMEINLNSINSEIVSAEKESVSSMNQIVACNKNGLFSDPYKRDFDSTTENASCVKKRKKRKVLEEQKDPDIKKFLNMILVLGDLEGAQYLLSTLDDNEDEVNAEISQESLSKSKKKSKKKKFKD